MQAGWRLLHHVTLSYQDELYGYLEQQALQRSIPVAANLLICSVGSSQQSTASKTDDVSHPGALTERLVLQGRRCDSSFHLILPRAIIWVPRAAGAAADCSSCNFAQRAAGSLQGGRGPSQPVQAGTLPQGGESAPG